MLSVKPGFSLSSFTCIKRLFVSSSPSVIRMVSSEVADTSPGDLDFSLWFIQPSIVCDVLYTRLNKWGRHVALTCSLASLGPVHPSMSDSSCCFLTCVQVSQEAGQVVWYAHLFKDIPQFVVIHTVKGFVIVNEAEVRLSGIPLLSLWTKHRKLDLWFTYLF